MALNFLYSSVFAKLYINKMKIDLHIQCHVKTFHINLNFSKNLNSKMSFLKMYKILKLTKTFKHVLKIILEY